MGRRRRGLSCSICQPVYSVQSVLRGPVHPARCNLFLPGLDEELSGPTGYIAISWEGLPVQSPTGTHSPGWLASPSVSLSPPYPTLPCRRPRGRYGRRHRACGASWTRTSPPPTTSRPRRRSRSSCAASAPGSTPRSAAPRRASLPRPRPGSRAPPRPAPTSAASGHEVRSRIRSRQQY